MTVDEIIQLLAAESKPVRTANGWLARCPAHDDQHASLSISEGDDGRILLHCFANCTADAVCAALGITTRNLFPAKLPKATTPRRRVVAQYDYTDEAGALLFQCVRYDPKDFRQRRPDPAKPGEWLWNLDGVPRVLYRLPELKSALSAGRSLFVAEGERDVEALVKHGFAATCNPMGAGKWLPEHTETLRGADVAIFPDRDAPGRKHATDVAAKLDGIASRVRIVELPDVNGHLVKDSSDFFQHGGSAEELRALVDGAPDWTPAQAATVESIKCDTAGVRGEIIGILRNSDLKPRDQRRRIADAVVAALGSRGQLYHHAEFRDFATAMYFDREANRLERIQADAFLAWLASWTGLSRADSLFAAVVAGIETAALADARSKSVSPEAFWARRGDRIYFSCGDAALCRISANEAELLANGTDEVLFEAGRTLRPWQLTTPRDFFETCRVFGDIQDAASNARDLVRLWICSLPTNPRSKPPLCLFGDVGSGKTRLALAIAELYGLAPIAAKVEERLEADFWPSVERGGLLVLDNADTKTRWLADAVAAASTGGCVTRRKLYSDRDVLPLRARAWLALTTSNATFANDSGFADRVLVVRLKRREGITSDAALSEEILANRDTGLSFIVRILATALADEVPTPDDLNARHPDFAQFAVRIARAAGREREGVAALKAAELDKSRFCLQTDPIAAALLAYLSESGSFIGTAAQLLPHLIEHDQELSGRLSAKRLGKRLNALWPHVVALCRASKELGRTGVTTFRFAGFAGFQEVFSENPSREASLRDFSEKTVSNPANPAAPTEKTLML